MTNDVNCFCKMNQKPINKKKMTKNNFSNKNFFFLLLLFGSQCFFVVFKSSKEMMKCWCIVRRTVFLRKLLYSKYRWKIMCVLPSCDLVIVCCHVFFSSLFCVFQIPHLHQCTHTPKHMYRLLCLFWVKNVNFTYHSTYVIPMVYIRKKTNLSLKW